MPVPDDRRYTDSHEWHKPADDGTVTIGISSFAVDELTDITYVEFAKADGPITAGESFGEIESVKATSELYSGVSGTVVAVNEALADNPGLINDDPWEQGWMIKIQTSDSALVEAMMTAEQYTQKHGS